MYRKTRSGTIGGRGTHSKKPYQQLLHRVVSRNPTDPRYKDADCSVYNAGKHLLNVDEEEKEKGRLTQGLQSTEDVM